MLKPDDARRQLSQWKSKKLKQERIQRLLKLPKPAATAGLALFQLLSTGKEPKDWSERYDLQRRSQRAVAADPALRKKILTALFTTFAKEIERGFVVLTRLPYPVGYARRPFRAPQRPELSAGLGAQYLDCLTTALIELPDDLLTPDWLAAWALHLDGNADRLGYLFAGQIDAGSDTVLEILKDSAANRHAIGGPGGHAIRGLLCCERPAAWEFVANLLLAAQRQEGLRQSILEAVDEAHPKAFQRLSGIILDQNLIRFAAAARAAGVWLGEELMVEDAKGMRAALTGVRDLQSNAALRTKTVKRGDAASLYRALWALAFENVDDALDAVKSILKEKNVGRRIAVVKLLGETNLAEAGELVLPLLNDIDPRLLSAALTFFTQYNPGEWDSDEMAESQMQTKPFPKALFETLEKLLPTLPEKATAVKSPVPTWPMSELSQGKAANLLVECLQGRPAERLLPWMPMMSPDQRVTALAKLCAPRTLTTKVRATLMACATETNTTVREAALGYLKKCTLAEDEVRTLEGHLTRKQPDFRRGVFELLLNRPDKLAVQSVERLLPGDVLQRAGGIEIARRLAEAERRPDAVRKVVATFQEAKGARLPEADRTAIDRILHPPEKPATLENGLGLFDPKDRSPVVPPRKTGVKISSPAAFEFLKQLDALVYEHRDKTIITKHYHGRQEEIVIGSIEYRWGFPQPDSDKTLKENLKQLPLKDIWFDWFDNRSAVTRDADGLELIRATLMRTQSIRGGDSDLEYEGNDDEAAIKTFKVLHPQPPVGLRHEAVVVTLVRWFLLKDMPKGGIEFALDAVEQSFALIPQSVHDKIPRGHSDDDTSDAAFYDDWRNLGFFKHTYQQLPTLKESPHWTPAHAGRLYQLLRWVEQPVPGVAVERAELLELLAAYDTGIATLADFYDSLIGVRKKSRYSSSNGDFDTLSTFTRDDRWRQDKAEKKIYVRHPELKTAVDKTVARVIEIELARGESPTAASDAVNGIHTIPGVAALIPLLVAVGKADFKSSYWNAGKNKPESLTHLIKSIRPTPGDTPAAFVKLVQPFIDSGKISLEKIVALGMVNTKLVNHAAAVVQWPGYEEVCYWFMAHAESTHARTLQSPGNDDADADEKAWRSLVKARSNLTAEQRADGVIDVEWFHKAYAALGKDDRWDAIEKAARFLGYGHAEKKAARLADVLLGRTKKKDLVENIQKKFLKESVRLLGLLPIPADAKKRDGELADRYAVLKAYERYARGLSSLSKEPAMRSYRLGMENLAVTAGFTDPVRLEWAVTAKETADLAKSPVSVKIKDVTLTLSLGDFAEPDTMQTQNGKELKSLPKDVKAHKSAEELLERKKGLKRLVSSTKRTLELAMCAGDRFTAAELAHLMTHPLVRPFLERLVLKSDADIGYPVKGGSALQLPNGKTVPVKAGAEWSIAHPLDFVAAKCWHDYQAECFKAERIQPFKQVFREVYTLTPAEKEDGDKSRRYSGQQVNENQAKALLSSRGWSTKDDLSKLYRAVGISVDLDLDRGYNTPGDAAAPAVRELRFYKRGDGKPLLLTDVPGVIFSEVMRDLDLVVSVAHVGGVDPETTQSTVAMRTSLLQETCTLLKLANVKFDSKHALIKGAYGQYSVHLGSGVVHKQPGGSLCVVAVNAQHRGRLFLPFADDDPRTAEVVTKVLLLARDQEIQDPTILEQIVAR